MERTRQVSRPARSWIGSPLRGYGLEARVQPRPRRPTFIHRDHRFSARLSGVPTGDNSEPDPPQEPGEQQPSEAPELALLPGTERTRRFRPKLRWELIGCGLHGHELVGTDAAEVRLEDHLLVRESDGLRWYRCLRCDSWLPLAPPRSAPNRFPPGRDEIQLPLRGRPLRNRYVLRLIALDRVVHFVVLAALGIAIILFAGHQKDLRGDYIRILNSLQASVGFVSSRNGFFREITHLVSLSTTKLYLYGSAFLRLCGDQRDRGGRVVGRTAMGGVPHFHRGHPSAAAGDL